MASVRSSPHFRNRERNGRILLRSVLRQLQPVAAFDDHGERRKVALGTFTTQRKRFVGGFRRRVGYVIHIVFLSRLYERDTRINPVDEQPPFAVSDFVVLGHGQRNLRLGRRCVDGPNLPVLGFDIDLVSREFTRIGLDGKLERSIVRHRSRRMRHIRRLADILHAAERSPCSCPQDRNPPSNSRR